MTKPSAPSFVRTLVPAAVGQLVAYVATLGIAVPGDVEIAMTVILGFIATTIWYVVVRFVEQKWPKFGALLGWAATPGVYAKRHIVAEPKGVVETGIISPHDGPNH